MAVGELFSGGDEFPESTVGRVLDPGTATGI